MAVILKPNNPASNAIATSLTIGEVMRKVVVTPKGIHAFKNPTNNGIAEQLQKGVITPKKEAKRYSNPYSLFFAKKSLIFSIGR
jgi:hypothetical protein